jgi:hypothetical protein
MVLYLGIPANSGIDKSRFNYHLIYDNLSGWLNSCCTQVRPVIINVINRPVSEMTRTDALVYLVGDPVYSVIARAHAPMLSDGFAVGRTSGWRGQLISEVYVNGRQTYPIAATIYHELLHNKLNLAYNVHGEPGGNFTSAEAPFWEGGPSAADQRLMCRALQTPPLAGQFTSGFSLPVAQ